MFNYLDDPNIDFIDDYSNEKFCERCNSSLSDVMATGIVGCANCYKTFENEIRNYLIRKQGFFNHIGKIALKMNTKMKISDEIAKLEKQKQQAVEEENFIVAESLKNQIKKLKGGI